MILSFADHKRRLRERNSTEPWCCICSEAFGERQYLSPHIFYTADGPETRFHCPQCGEEFD